MLILSQNRTVVCNTDNVAFIATYKYADANNEEVRWSITAETGMGSTQELGVYKSRDRAEEILKDIQHRNEVGCYTMPECS